MNDPFDASLATWVRDDGPARAPGQGLDAALAAVATVVQRPAWRVGRWWLGDRMGSSLRTTARVAAIAVAIVLVLGLLAEAGFGRLVGHPYSLAYVTRENSEDQLFVASGDGSSRRQVAVVPGLEFGSADVRWSPDHAYLAWLIGNVDNLQRLLIFDAAGGLVGRHDSDNALVGFAWAPDGRRLAIESTRASDHLDIIDVTGTRLRSIPLPSGFEIAAGAWNGPMAWSPDGRFLATPACMPASCNGKAVADVYLIPVDGSPTRRLTSAGAGDGWLAWAPDGRLAVARDCPLAGASCKPGVLVFDRAQLDAASPSPARPAGLDGKLIGWLSWSPDGRMLAATVNTPGSQTTVAYGVVVVDGSGRVIRDAEGYVMSDVVDWTSNAASVVYNGVAKAPDVNTIWALDVAGGDPRPLVRDIEQFDLDGRP